MELTFSLSELNRKSPYLLESSGGCSLDGVDYFASVIMRKDSPRFAAMTEAIDRFIEDFQDKLR